MSLHSADMIVTTAQSNSALLGTVDPTMQDSCATLPPEENAIESPIENANGCSGNIIEPHTQAEDVANTELPLEDQNRAGEPQSEGFDTVLAQAVVANEYADQPVEPAPLDTTIHANTDTLVQTDDETAAVLPATGSEQQPGVPAPTTGTDGLEKQSDQPPPLPMSSDSRTVAENREQSPETMETDEEPEVQSSVAGKQPVSPRSPHKAVALRGTTHSIPPTTQSEPEVQAASADKVELSRSAAQQPTRLEDGPPLPSTINNAGGKAAEHHEAGDDKGAMPIIASGTGNDAGDSDQQPSMNEDSDGRSSSGNASVADQTSGSQMDFAKQLQNTEPLTQLHTPDSPAPVSTVLEPEPTTADAAGANLNIPARAETLQQLVARFDEHALELISKTDGSVTVSLEPHNLGRVILSCRDTGGELAFELITETRQAHAFLAEHEDDIRNLVENTGYRLSQFDVKTQGEDARNNSPFERRSTGNKQANTASVGTEAATITSLPQQAKTVGSGEFWMVA